MSPANHSRPHGIIRAILSGKYLVLLLVLPAILGPSALARAQNGDQRNFPVVIHVSKRIVWSTDIAQKGSCEQASKKYHDELSWNLELKGDKLPGDLSGGAGFDISLGSLAATDNPGSGLTTTGTITQVGEESEERSDCQGYHFTRHLQHNARATLNPSEGNFEFQFDNESKLANINLTLHWAEPDATGSEQTKETSPNTNQSHTTDVGAAYKIALRSNAIPYAGSLLLRGYARSAATGVSAAASNKAPNGAIDVAMKALDDMAAGGPASVKQTANGFIITYSRSATQAKPIDDGWSGSVTQTTTTEVQIFINARPPKFDALLEPLVAADYQQFIPEGPRVDGSSSGGNMLAFRVRIVDKDHPDQDLTQGNPFTITYALRSVSKYPGYCMNYPKKDAADDKPDLRFDSAMKSLPIVAQMDDQRLVSADGQGNGLTVVYVRSYDYASYGELTAHISMKDQGVELDAHLTGRPDEQKITIPKDDNGNKIADAWEKKVGIWGKTSDANFDEDALPTGQRRNGDGYTMFEEYRGFKVEGNLFKKEANELFQHGHLRMDPNFKDIFITDEDHLFSKYYAPYNPSDLNWHYITNDEMLYNARGKDPDNRWMNFNKVEEHFYARQYALILANKPRVEEGLMGQQMDVLRLRDYEDHQYVDQGYEPGPNGYDQAVKHTIDIEIYPEEIENQARHFGAANQNAFNYLIINNVTHELGHALGICHHNANNANPGNPEQGVSDCTIRYQTTGEAAHLVVYLRYRYCNKNDVWKETITATPDPGNPPKATPLSVVTHPSNNCYGMIDIKSDP
jgi:hypothetical protein